VNAGNARAIAFYTRYGFVQAGMIPNEILGAARPMTDILMIRTDA
jgi:ribosomal protein S18 acetylase RimI-like enzyme